ncbi:MAG TPA: pyridoxal 5'-phosphate synthase glutaminase subunit PdxT [Thermoplasmata archaeon]|nr:pyridoxal 5'-phosphate synthase glutaminase subunit PdxT [Thermoplasmata archaeon]
MKKVGVISLQGAISEHKEILNKSFEKLGLKGDVILIRKKEDLERVYGVIIPGGESTTISRLIKKFDLHELLVKRAEEEDMPVMGTCAGLILLARYGDESVISKGVEPLGILDIKVQRNAFGRQKESFQIPLKIKGLDKPFLGVFIRAPLIEKAYGRCEIYSTLKDGTIVMVREKNRLGLSFHPELTEDTRLHEMFLMM